MPIISIINQPPKNKLQAAYRPIVIIFSATQVDPIAGRFIPPVVYCDIYFNGVFYKTMNSTQPINKPVFGTIDPQYQFDIQDACQEFLVKVLPANGQSTIVQALGVMSQVTCKLRASTIDADGFTTPEGPIPIQGTGKNVPVSGGGTETEEFYVVNATLQHEDNPDLNTHLNSFKNRSWSRLAYPLSHRPEGYKICHTDSDVFPIIYLGSVPLSCIKVKYKMRGENFFRTKTTCHIECIKVSIPGMNIEDPVVGFPGFQVWSIYGTPPFTLSNVVLPPWGNLDIIEKTPGNFILRFYGTSPEVQDNVLISFKIQNCEGSADFNYEQLISVKEVGDTNLKCANGINEDSGYVIENVLPTTFYSISNGSLPVPYGGSFGALHTGTSEAISVVISGSLLLANNPLLRLYAGVGTLTSVQELEVTGPGTFTFDLIAFSPSTELLIVLEEV